MEIWRSPWSTDLFPSPKTARPVLGAPFSIARPRQICYDCKRFVRIVSRSLTERAGKIASIGGICVNECILVVDDDPEIVRAIAILLEKEGYQVLKAYNGMEAL